MERARSCALPKTAYCIIMVLCTPTVAHARVLCIPRQLRASRGRGQPTHALRKRGCILLLAPRPITVAPRYRVASRDAKQPDVSLRGSHPRPRDGERTVSQRAVWELSRAADAHGASPLLPYGVMPLCHDMLLRFAASAFFLRAVTTTNDAAAVELSGEQPVLRMLTSLPARKRWFHLLRFISPRPVYIRWPWVYLTFREIPRVHSAVLLHPYKRTTQ